MMLIAPLSVFTEGGWGWVLRDTRQCLADNEGSVQINASKSDIIISVSLAQRQ